MSFPNPATILKEAIKSVPEVKWALAIAGIISVVAIVRVGWKIDPMVAVLGTIVMLVLMAVLVVFAKLSTTAATEFRYAIQVFMWASLLLTIAAAALLFTSVFFQWPPVFAARIYKAPANDVVYQPTVGDPKVWDLEQQVNNLRGTWETVPEYGEATKKEVLERATKVGSNLLDVDDKELGPSGHVIKREYSCYAFIMAADTETSQEWKTKYAQQAIDLCKSASDDLRFVFANKAQNRNLEYVAAWAKRMDQEPFVDYLSAMALCIQATSTSDHQKKVAATNILQRVPTYYLNRYPPTRDSTLKGCLESKGDLK
jgi:hypothetical protein